MSDPNDLWGSLEADYGAKGYAPSADAAPSLAPAQAAAVAPQADPSAHADIWNSLEKDYGVVNQAAGPVENASSGFLSGLAGMADLNKYNPMGGLSDTISNKLLSMLGGPTVAQPAGDAIRQDADSLTGVKGSTNINPDSYAHKIGSYLPGVLLGPEQLIGNGLKGGAELVAKVAAEDAAFAGAGYAGNKVGGPWGELGATLGLGGAYAGGAALLESQSAEAIAARQLAKAGKADILKIPDSAPPGDPFFNTRTLAEETQNPKLAQLQNLLGKRNDDANALLVTNDAARGAKQDALFNSLSSEPAKSAEAGSSALQGFVDAHQQSLLDALSGAPKTSEEVAQNAIRAMIEGKQGDLLQSLSSEPGRTAEAAGSNVRSLIAENADNQITAAQRKFGIQDQNAEIPYGDLRTGLKKTLADEYKSGGEPKSLVDIAKEANKPTTLEDGTVSLPDSHPFDKAYDLRERASLAYQKAKEMGDGKATRVAKMFVDQIDGSIESSPDVNTAIYRDAKDTYSRVMDTFRSGKVGASLQGPKAGQFTVKDSEVMSKYFDGTPEGTKALIRALPETPEAIEATRGAVRDMIESQARGPDGVLDPRKVAKFIDNNRDALVAEHGGRSLFNDQSLGTLQKLADTPKAAGTFFDGTPEGTRKLLNALPDYGKSLETTRGAVRDLIRSESTGADGILDPAKLAKFLKDNRDGLTAEVNGTPLLTPKHMDALDAITQTPKAVGKYFDGTPEGTRQLLRTIPNDPQALEVARGAIRDQIRQNTTTNDGVFAPEKFRSYLKNNREALSAEVGGRELFAPDHLDNLEQIAKDLALTSSSSRQSVASMAGRASKGNSTTAQALLMGSAKAGIKNGRFVEGFGKYWSGKVDEVLTKALILDKSVARALVQPATESRVSKIASLFPSFGPLSPLSSLAHTQLAAGGTAYDQGSQAAPRLESLSTRFSGNQSSAPLPQLPEVSAPVKQQSQSSSALTTTPPDPIETAVQRAEAKMAKIPEAPTILSAKRVQDKALTADKKASPDLVAAVIGQESGGRKDVVSKTGAVGLMQLEPATAKEWAKKLGMKSYDLTNPADNQKIGEAYLNHLLDHYDGDLPLALTAYNQGPTRVDNLLTATGGTTLEDIKPRLGPVGKVYAKQTLARLRKA